MTDILVDTNILVDIFEDDPDWSEWSIHTLRAQSTVHRLVINPIIFAELSLTFTTFEALDAAIETLGLLMREIPKPALFLAGKAFIRYRRAGGIKSNVLPDFMIGAHAAVIQSAIITRDARRYRQYFPTVKLITPDD